ncbi:zinc ribbon domain-containing protein [Micromonospora sp. CB01531]|uniref:zinc ribbon domain-containing protein n=1 Tax=Micromonospora sp. CB01531 TaxID=1718947 RepID=UPI003083AB8A
MSPPCSRCWLTSRRLSVPVASQTGCRQVNVVACGHQDHADVNAAKNILAAGLAITTRGDLTTGLSGKRQPPERLAA